jgi:DNA uptake protein ComE-like DNA-binding protein
MRPLHTLGAAVAAIALCACGGSDNTATSDAQSVATTASSTTTVASSASASVATTAASSTAIPSTTRSTTAKVNANKATRAELQTAFQAAGVSNAAQWAREVEEYRPYAADDANWSKLRKELAKYNIASDVLEKIIATLEV